MLNPALGVADHPARILIVDDERQNRLLLEVMLAPEGFILQTAASGEEALAMVAQQPPDLILLDVMMPGMDGYQVTARLKGDLATKNIPIVIVTALEDREARLLGLSAGAEDFLSKPLSHAELRARVRNLLRLKAHVDFCDKYSQLLEDEVGSRAVELRKLWNALDQSPLGVVLSDTEGHIEYVNPSFVDMTGYCASEALGRKISLVKSGFHPPEFYQTLWTTILSGQVFRGEMCNLRKSGELYWVQAVIAPVRDGEGEIVNFFAFQQDVTDRKRVERQLIESEEKFKGIFDAMQEGYISADLAGTVTLVNPAAVRLFGYGDAAELLAVPVGELFADEQERDKVLAPVLELGHMASHRGTFRRKDGALRICEGSFRVRPGLDGQPRFVDCLFRDITERVQAEEEHQARQAADEANRLKSEFLAHMSHEIRTPLHAILGMTQLALGTRLNKQQRHYMDHVQSGGQNLLAIVNDILDFSKVEAGQLELERVDFLLDDVLENVILVLASKANEKGLEFILQVAPEVPAYLLGDPGRLGQVLINLLSNAIKFTHRGQVVLSIALGPGASGRIGLGFEIRDTGVGLTAEQIDHLFVAFAQADSSTTRKYGGTGLGLAISLRLIQLMQGEIQVQSIPDQGSTFTFTALFDPSPAAEAGPLADLSNLCALLIEDQVTSREVLASALRRLSLRVTEATLGEVDAVEQTYDLIFVARLDNLEPVRRRFKTPIVLLAHHGEEGVAERAATLGVNFVLLKPFTLSHLVDTIQSALDRPELKRRHLEKLPTEVPSGVLQAIRGARVLVVEDIEINQEIVQELLHSAGLEVDVASNGRQAVDRVLGCGPSCPWQAILMDLQMPEMDGYAATAAIREHDRFRQLPILAMTAHVLPEVRQRCLAVGMDDYISKPIDPNGLLTTLGRWISIPNTARPLSAEFPQIAGIDTLNGLSRLAGNVSLYRSLLLDLAGQHQQTWEALQVALGQADAEQLARLAHGLKGTAANLGVLKVASQAAELETLACAGLPAAECLARLRDTLVQLDGLIRAALESWLPPAVRDQVSACGSGQPDSARAAVARLETLLESCDGAAADALQEVHRMVEPWARPGQLDRLSQLVDRFEFDEALAELRGLDMRFSSAAGA